MKRDACRAGLFTVLILVLRTASGSEAKPTLQEIVERLRESEQKLVNVTFHSECNVEEYDEASQRWKPTPLGTTCTAWYNGMPGSKARVDVEKNVTPWIRDRNKPNNMDYSFDSFSMAYDGEYCRNIDLKRGSLGKPMNSTRGAVWGERQKKLDYLSQENGACLSIYFRDPKNHQGLSQELDQLLQHDTQIQISNEKFEGTPCLKITTGEKPWGYETWWLSPEKGYALLGHKLINQKAGNEEVYRYEETITSLQEVSDGIWFPVEAETIHKDTRLPGKPNIRKTYLFSKIIANDPAFDETVFTLRFPPGYSIKDHVRGMVFKAGANPDVLETELEAMVEEMKEGSDKSASSGETTAETDFESKAEETDPSPQNSIPSKKLEAAVSGNTRVVFLLMLLILAVIFGLFYFKFFRKKKGVLLLACIFLWISECRGSDHSAGKPAVSDSFQNFYYMNCGVNVGYLTLRLLGASANVEQVAQEIHVGQQYENQSSFYDLKTLFENYGLKADAYSAADVQTIKEYLKPGSILIIHLTRKIRNQDKNHFLIYMNNQNLIYVFDYPQKIRNYPFTDLDKDTTFSMFSGKFMVVTRTAQNSVLRPKLFLEKEIIDVGTIPMHVQEIVGRIPYRNDGEAVLKIESIQSSCSCTAEITGDRELAPGEKGELQVILDKSKLSYGSVKKFIKIQTNDPERPFAIITFLLQIQQLPAKKDILLYPQVIDYGRATCQDILHKKKIIRIQIPEELFKDITNIEVSSNIPNLHLEEISETTGKFTEGRLEKQYQVSWIGELKKGYFEHEIRFVISKGDESEYIKAIVKGDVLSL